MVACILKVSIHIPGSGSLKAKRSVVKSLIEKLRAKYKLSVAETGDNDLWQRSEIGISFVAKDKASLDVVSQRIRTLLDSGAEFQVLEIVEEELWI